MKRDARSRVLPMKVFVTGVERERIKHRAKSAGLSVSAFLRAAGLNQPIRSMLDHDAVRRVAIELSTWRSGRIGGSAGDYILDLADRAG